MKQLILFRHGKSSWSDGTLADVDRPLLQKGRKRTEKMVKYLIDKKIYIDFIVSSHAVRAYQTATIVADLMSIGEDDFVIENNLYHASTDRIWDVIISLPEDKERVILFGHNPGFTEFTKRVGKSLTDWLPTSGVSFFEFGCDHWFETPLATTKKHFVLCPSKLK